MTLSVKTEPETDAQQRLVADAVLDLLKHTETNMEEAAILQILIGTSLHALAYRTSNEVVSSWLAKNVTYFERLHAEQQGGLN